MRFHEIFRFREDLCPKKSCCIVIDYAIMVSAQSLTTQPRRICIFYLKKIKIIIILTLCHHCMSAYVLLMQPQTKWMRYPHSQLYVLRAHDNDRTFWQLTRAQKQLGVLSLTTRTSNFPTLQQNISAKNKNKILRTIFA